MPSLFDDDNLNKKGLGITIISALQECKLPAYVHMRSAKSSCDICSNIYTYLRVHRVYIHTIWTDRRTCVALELCMDVLRSLLVDNLFHMYSVR